MRSSLFLAAIPLAAALPRVLPGNGALEQLGGLARRGDGSHFTTSSATIPSSMYPPSATLKDQRGNTAVISRHGEGVGDFPRDRASLLRTIGGDINHLPDGLYEIEQTPGQPTIIRYTHGSATDPKSAPVQVEIPSVSDAAEPSAAAASAAPKSDNSPDADFDSYQTYLENLHNNVRAPHGNKTPLRWSDDMYEVAHAWASQCQFKHSNLDGSLAENIAFQSDAANSLDALKKSFEAWYYEEAPFINFDEAGPSTTMKTEDKVPVSQRYNGKVPATVSHALNGLSLSYQEAAAASVFCDKLTTYTWDSKTGQQVASVVHTNVWYTVASYTGQGPSDGWLHAANEAVPALDSISH